MSFFFDNEQKINEIIFAKRNKSYGAYAIRSSYGSTVTRALLLVIFGFCSLMSLAFYLVNRNNGPEKNEKFEQIVDSLVIVEFKAKQPEPEKPKVEQPRSTPQNNNSGSSMGTQVADSVAVNTNTVTNDNAAGNGSVTNTDGPATPSVGGTGNSTIVNTPTLDPDPVPDPDQNPEFEGGLGALYRFLGSKLVYPEIAKEIGKEGTVYVRFVVDEYGRVGDLRLMNNVGYGLDEEARRVVSMLPKFKSPGIKNGKPVKVYYQLPIKFRLR
jgi:periplasmic protein TonB